MFKFEYINNKKILKSDLIQSATAFFTTRESVITPNALTELKTLCNKNKEEIADYLGINKENIISPNQTHSANIAIAKIGKEYPETDALVTDSTDLALALNFADCTPIILVDDTKNVAAISHAGWRGTAASIVPKTIKFMQDNFNVNVLDVKALIGPAISIENYKVGKDVYEQIKATLNNKYDDYWQYDETDQKYSIDLKTVNFHQLIESGVDIRRIDKCNYCTYHSNDVFFSYRKENGVTARHSAIIKLNNT